MCDDVTCACQCKGIEAAEKFFDLWERLYSIQEETEIYNRLRSEGLT